MQFLRICFQNAASAIEVSRRNYQFVPATRSGSANEASYMKNEKRKTKNEFVFRFSYFTFENEKRKTKNEKGIRFSFANLKTKNEKTVYTRTKRIHML